MKKWSFPDMFDAKCDKEYFARLCVEFRQSGTRLAEAASRVIDSVTTGQCDGIHRLTLAVSDWYKTIANERQLLEAAKQERIKEERAELE
jgi:hypothetical protein